MLLLNNKYMNRIYIYKKNVSKYYISHFVRVLRTPRSNTTRFPAHARANDF